MAVWVNELAVEGRKARRKEDRREENVDQVQLCKYRFQSNRDGYHSSPHQHLDVEI